MSNYICSICHAYQTKDGVDKVYDHIEENHKEIQVDRSKIEHVLVQC